MATKTPQKFLGTTGWALNANIDETSVDRAILRSHNELIIDFVFEGLRYTATLKRAAGNEFRGRYTSRLGGKPHEDSANCRLFTSPNGIFLFGEWAEDGDHFIWWAELNAVKKFPDENRSARGK